MKNAMTTATDILQMLLFRLFLCSRVSSLLILGMGVWFLNFLTIKLYDIMIKNMEIGYVNSTKAVKKVALHQKGKTFFFSLSALTTNTADVPRASNWLHTLIIDKYHKRRRHKRQLIPWNFTNIHYTIDKLYNICICIPISTATSNSFERRLRLLQHLPWTQTRSRTVDVCLLKSKLECTKLTNSFCLRLSVTLQEENCAIRSREATLETAHTIIADLLLIHYPGCQRFSKRRAVKRR